MSSSLLSDPSTVKLLARERRPLTANCPAEPTPAPTPGPATLPNVCGGRATPGKSKANSSKDRVLVVPPSGNATISSAADDPLRRASTVISSARVSVSSTEPGPGATDGRVAPAGSRATGTGTTSPVYVILKRCRIVRV